MSLSHIEQSLETGNPEDQYKLGLIYLKIFELALNHTVEEEGSDKEDWDKRKEKAMYWFKKAAEQGHAPAQCEIGDLILDDYIDHFPEEYDEAAKWYRMAAEQGYPKGQFRYGGSCEEGLEPGQNDAAAMKWYQMAAEQGYVPAYLELADIYSSSRMIKDRSPGVTYIKPDDGESANWYRMAAQRGNAHGQLRLGSCYAHGTGVEQDYTEAVKWYCLAAEQGNYFAQNLLGDMYEEGRGVAQDNAAAEKWYGMAAEQENLTGQWALERIGMKSNI